jgi:putative membrane protein
MRKLNFFFVAIAALSFMASCNNSSNDSTKNAEKVNEQKKDSSAMPATVDKDDADFLVKAASGGMMEVQAGQIAKDKAMSSDVKKFGEQMVSDHSKANDELKALAAKKNVTIPATMGNDEQDKINKLNKETGWDFDKKYMSEMVDDHESDVKMFQKEATDGKDADIKAWAAKTVPTLDMHLDMAKKTKDIVDKEKKMHKK